MATKALLTQTLGHGGSIVTDEIDHLEVLIDIFTGDKKLYIKDARCYEAFVPRVALVIIPRVQTNGNVFLCTSSNGG